jgi:glycosyltransferase involved in cell wall biosynthesis
VKLFFICDLNSSHARSWVRYFIKQGHEVTLFSTTAAGNSFEGANIYSAPNAPASITPEVGQGMIARQGARLAALGPILELAQVELKKRAYLRRVQTQAPVVQELVRKVQPDLVHSLRIPIEGFLGARIDRPTPLAVSVWGNDLIFFATEEKRYADETRRTLQRCDILFADCRRDILLARQFGFAENKPSYVVPGAGGIPRLDLERARGWLDRRGTMFDHLKKSERSLVLLNPRGFGNQSLNNIPLLRAMRKVIDAGTDVILIITGRMKTYRAMVLERAIRRLHLQGRVHLVPEFPHDEMMKAYTSADCLISPMHHDGIPNSLIEAMAYGAIPVVSSIASIREWIRDGENGFLFDPVDDNSIAEAIQRAMMTRYRYEQMRRENHEYVTLHAEYESCMKQVEGKLVELLRLTGTNT